MNKILLSASLLLCAGFCFAKNAVPAGPFQWGHTLKPLSTTKMRRSGGLEQPERSQKDF